MTQRLDVLPRPTVSGPADCLGCDSEPSGQCGMRFRRGADFFHDVGGQFRVAPTAHVDRLFHEIQMVEIDASRVFAEVIDHKTGCDWSVDPFPRHAMRQLLTEASITFLVADTNPDPTASGRIIPPAFVEVESLHTRAVTGDIGSSTFSFDIRKFSAAAGTFSRWVWRSSPTKVVSMDETLWLAFRAFPSPARINSQWRKATATAFAQLRTRVFVHAASHDEVVKGDASECSRPLHLIGSRA